MNDISALNRQFAIPGQADFRPGPGDLVFVDVRNQLATASLCLQGAHLLSWVPTGEEPVGGGAKFKCGVGATFSWHRYCRKDGEDRAA